ncbi:MAG: tol-pal system protein YbgF [Kiloniellales bacterium]
MGRLVVGAIWVFGLAAPAVLVGLAATAHAQGREAESLVERVDRLERQLYLGGTASGVGQPSPLGMARPGPGAGLEGGPIAAQMDVRISALETALAEQTGRIEQVLHRLDRMQARLEKLVADVDFRLRELETAGLGGAEGLGSADAAPAGLPPPGGGSAGPPGQAVAAGTAPRSAAAGILGTLTVSRERAARLGLAPDAGAGTGDAATVAAAPKQTAAAPPLIQLPPGSPKARYEFARSLLKRARYDEAESAFRQFIAAHGDDPLAGNARYWLAETYYVRGRYKESAETYLDGYQKFPNGVKAPDNLLKLGVSLGRLGDKAEACAAFDRLAEAFPNASPPIRQRAQRERAGIGCP